MTVFFALLSTVFLGVLFIMTESLRYQGVRVHAQQIADMGHYSVFGEFEKKLLTDFDLFGVDGAYGTGDFSIDRVRDRYRQFMQINENPAAQGLRALCFDPWKVSSTQVQVEGYTLLTDGGGEAFYQQAVAFMRKTALLQSTGKLLAWYRDAGEAQKNRETYEKEKISADRELQELEKQAEEKRKEQEEQEGQEQAPDSSQESTVKVENPIPALRRLRRKDILTITCGNARISDGVVRKASLSSRRKLKKGTLAVGGKNGGLVNHLLFKEYLLEKFGCYREQRQEGALQYELEYILEGKTADKANLKAVIYQLLLMREGCNYVYCVGDEQMNAQTGALAGALIGWTGLPALTAVLKHALLLGWAYAESLLDVRGLMEGKKIPLLKESGSWRLSLENLAKINEMLEQGGNGGEEGLSYRGYLRLLLYLQGIGIQKKRGLDLVELRVRAGDGLSQFAVDHCVVALQEQTTFYAPALFSRVTGAFLGAMGQGQTFKVDSGFSYLQ